MFLLAGTLSGLGGLLGTTPAIAQTRPTVSVPPIVAVEPAARSRLPIQVGPPNAVVRNSFIRIRGLPPAAALSEGHAIAPGAWSVPLNGLANLSVILPVGVQGSSDISVTLVDVNGMVLAEAKTTLAVERPATAAAPAMSASQGRQEETPARSGALVPSAPLLAPAERERALVLYEKGIEQLERGNVYAARKFFERAAETGLVQAALALAATYDPGELAKMKVIGLQPDIEAARKWYERARELGAAEAAERLQRLGAVR